MEQLLRYGVLSTPSSSARQSAVASGEFGLEQLLEKIRKSWAEIAFVTLNHRDQSDVFILGGIDEVITQLEDSQVALQTILASRFVGGIREEVEEWEKKLSLLSEMLDEWLACQRSWMYLENIFGAEDIQKQLPAESIKFSKIDKFFKDRMRKCHDNPERHRQVMCPTCSRPSSTPTRCSTRSRSRSRTTSRRSARRSRASTSCRTTSCWRSSRRRATRTRCSLT